MSENVCWTIASADLEDGLRAIRVAALTIFQTGTFAAGAKLAAVVFTVFSYRSGRV